MDPLISCSGSQTIDIKLVKEQLRLLGHSVDETVILAFLEGLGATAYGGNDKSDSNGKATVHTTEECDTTSPSMVSTTLSSSAETVRKSSHAVPSAAYTASIPIPSMAVPDAARSSFESDQQSPSPKQPAGQGTPPAGTTLNQRCRRYLARVSRQPSLQQQLGPHVYFQPDSIQQNITSLDQYVAPHHAETSGSEGDSLCLLDPGSAAVAEVRIDAVHDSAASQPVDMPDQQVQQHAAAGNCHLASREPITSPRQPLAAQSASADISSALSRLQGSRHSINHPQQPVASASSMTVQRSPDLESTDTLHLVGTESSAHNISSKETDSAQNAECHDLPRFGFRPGYRPAGVHIPSLLSPESVGLTRHIAQQSSGHSQQQTHSIARSEKNLQQTRYIPALDDLLRSSGTAAVAVTDTASPADDRGLPLPTKVANITSDRPRCTGVILPRVGHTALSQAMSTARPAVKVAMPAAGTGAVCSDSIQTARPPSVRCFSQAVPPSISATSSSRSIHSYSSSRSITSTSSTLSAQAIYCEQLSLYGRHKRITAVAPGVQKTDRVARFQQMQRQWKRDRFLSGGASGCSSGAGSSSMRGSVLTGGRAASERAVLHRQTVVDKKHLDV